MMLDFELPTHPRTGLQAVGLLRNGAPVWPALGGSEDDVVISDAADADSGAADTDTADTSATDVDDDGDDGDDKPLGAAGEKALAAEKERRRAAARLRREAIRERDDALAELDKLRKSMPKPAAKDAAKDGDDKAEAPDLDAIRAEAREQAKAEAKAEGLKDRVSDKIEVLAARRFTDADVAVTLLLKSSEIEDFLDDGKIDAEAIKEALDELLEKRPYLAVAAQSGKRFQGSGDGGARKGPQKPAQLTDADLKRMSPEAIVQAQAEGRFDDLLGAPS